MTLGERITEYRKRAGLSQEALAEQVGVSRQAVSKWELDDATPEVSKLVALAKTFGVTTDQLLGEDAPQPEPSGTPEPAAPSRRGPWGRVERMVGRYGWVAGFYIALRGSLFTLAAGFGVSWVTQMLRRLTLFPGGMASPVGGMLRAFQILLAVLLALGVAITVGGVVLALWLRKKRKKED